MRIARNEVERGLRFGQHFVVTLIGKHVVEHRAHVLTCRIVLYVPVLQARFVFVRGSLGNRHRAAVFPIVIIGQIARRHLGLLNLFVLDERQRRKLDIEHGLVDVVVEVGIARVDDPADELVALLPLGHVGFEAPVFMDVTDAVEQARAGRRARALADRNHHIEHERLTGLERAAEIPRHVFAILQKVRAELVFLRDIGAQSRVRHELLVIDAHGFAGFVDDVIRPRNGGVIETRRIHLVAVVIDARVGGVAVIQGAFGVVLDIRPRFIEELAGFGRHVFDEREHDRQIGPGGRVGLVVDAEGAERLGRKVGQLQAVFHHARQARVDGEVLLPRVAFLRRAVEILLVHVDGEVGLLGIAVQTCPGALGRGELRIVVARARRCEMVHMHRRDLLVGRGRDGSARRIRAHRFGHRRAVDGFEVARGVIHRIAVFVALHLPADILPFGVDVVGLLRTERFGTRRIVGNRIDRHAEALRHRIDPRERVVGKRLFALLSCSRVDILGLHDPAKLPDNVIFADGLLDLDFVDRVVDLVGNGIAVSVAQHDPLALRIAVGLHAGKGICGIALVGPVVGCRIFGNHASEHVHAQVVFDLFEIRRLFGGNPAVGSVDPLRDAVGACDLPHAHIDGFEVVPHQLALVGRIARQALQGAAQRNLPVHHEGVDRSAVVGGLVEQHAVFAVDVRVVGDVGAQVGIAHQRAQLERVDTRRGIGIGHGEAACRRERVAVAQIAVAVVIDLGGGRRGRAVFGKLDEIEGLVVLGGERLVEYRRGIAVLVAVERRLGLDFHRPVGSDEAMIPRLVPRTVDLDPRTVGAFDAHICARLFDGLLFERPIQIGGGRLPSERRGILLAHRVVDTRLHLERQRVARSEIAVDMHARTSRIDERIVARELVVGFIRRRGDVDDERLAVVVFRLGRIRCRRRLVRVAGVGLGIVGVGEVVGSPVGGLFDMHEPAFVVKLLGRDDARLLHIGSQVFEIERFAFEIVPVGQRRLVVEGHVARQIDHETQLRMIQRTLMGAVVFRRRLVFHLHAVPRGIAVLQRLAEIGGILLRGRGTGSVDVLPCRGVFALIEHAVACGRTHGRETVGFGVELDGMRCHQTRLRRTQLQRGEHARVRALVGHARLFAGERVGAHAVGIGVERMQKRRIGAVRRNGQVGQGQRRAERVVFHARAVACVFFRIAVLESGQRIGGCLEHRILPVVDRIGGNKTENRAVLVFCLVSIEAIIGVRVAERNARTAHGIRIAAARFDRLDVVVGQEAIAPHLRGHIGRNVLVGAHGFSVLRIEARRRHRAQIHLERAHASRRNARLRIAVDDGSLCPVGVVGLRDEAHDIARHGLARTVGCGEGLVRHERVEELLILRVVAGKRAFIGAVIVGRCRGNRPILGSERILLAVGRIRLAVAADHRDAFGNDRCHHGQRQIAHGAAVGGVIVHVARIHGFRVIRIVFAQGVEPVAIFHVHIQLHALHLGIQIVCIGIARHAVVADGVPHAHERLALLGRTARGGPNARAAFIGREKRDAGRGEVVFDGRAERRIGRYRNAVVLHGLVARKRHIGRAVAQIPAAARVGIAPVAESLYRPLVIHAEHLKVVLGRIGIAAFEVIDVEHVVIRACGARFSGRLVVPRSHEQTVVPGAVFVVREHMARNFHVDLISAVGIGVGVGSVGLRRIDGAAEPFAQIVLDRDFENPRLRAFRVACAFAVGAFRLLRFVHRVIRRRRGIVLRAVGEHVADIVAGGVLRIARRVVAAIVAVRRLQHFDGIGVGGNVDEDVGQRGVFRVIAVPALLLKHAGLHVEHRRRKRTAFDDRGKVRPLGERGLHAARHHVDHLHAVERAVAVIERLQTRREVLVVLQHGIVAVEHDSLRVVDVVAFADLIFVGLDIRLMRIAHDIGIAAASVGALLFVALRVAGFERARRGKPGAAQMQARLAPYQRRGDAPVAFEGRTGIRHELMEVSVVFVVLLQILRFLLQVALLIFVRREKPRIRGKRIHEIVAVGHARRVARLLGGAFGFHVGVEEHVVVARFAFRFVHLSVDRRPGNIGIGRIEGFPSVGLRGLVARKRRFVHQGVHVHELRGGSDLPHVIGSGNAEIGAEAVDVVLGAVPEFRVVFADPREKRRGAVGIGCQIAVLVERYARKPVRFRLHRERDLDPVADFHAHGRAVGALVGDAVQIERRLVADALRARVEVVERLAGLEPEIGGARRRFRVGHRPAVVGRGATCCIHLFHGQRSARRSLGKHLVSVPVDPRDMQHIGRERRGIGSGHLQI